MKKKSLIITLTIIITLTCILAIAAAFYFSEYSIKRDRDVAEVQKIVSDKFDSERNNIIGIGLEEKEYIYLTATDDDLVVVHLQRGLFGRKKFNGMSYSDCSFCNGVVVVDDAKFIVIGGRNENHQIAKIEFSLDSKMYEVELKNPGELFLECIKIDANTESIHIEPQSMRLFNSIGEDVTSQYSLNCFGI